RQPQPQNGAAPLAAGAWTQAAVTVAGFPALGVAHGLDGNAGQVAPGNIGGVSWASLAAGDRHTVAITANGELWVWGSNSDHGQLGLGLGWGMHRNTPTRVGNASNWASVAATDEHTFAITTNGELWAWGSNVGGQLGLGDSGWDTNRNTPTRVGGRSDWRSVATGVWGYTNDEFLYQAVALAITTNGELWAWGGNWAGQLGLGDDVARSVPARVGSANNWASVSTNGGSSFAITTNGELFAWGNNWDSHLGFGDNIARSVPTRVGTANNWASVTTGERHTVAITTNGELWVWGSNDAGGLGLGDSGWNTRRNTPTRVGNANNWVSAVAGTTNRTMAITANGELWAWGNNETGGLGLGDSGWDTNRNTPTRVGNASNWVSVSITNGGIGGMRHIPDFTVAVTTNGELWAWGDNSSEHLGLGDNVSRNTPTRVGGASN
ncbi:MAG: chromosome condensation regulator RCC1, partial [Spirochaetes bacterium]|nr:chromosome condensation regulator RCC1 [Spirochaetota bacterium]